MNDNQISIPEEIVMSNIYIVRGRKIMLDQDLSELYGVETKQLKRAVRRNENRFPCDFMFILSPDESENLRCQFGASSWGGNRYLPMAFTEQGIAMLSSVLNSERAIFVNIQIIRVFTKMRQLLESIPSATGVLPAKNANVRLADKNLYAKHTVVFKFWSGI